MDPSPSGTESAPDDRVYRQRAVADFGDRALEDRGFDDVCRDATRTVAETLGVESCSCTVLERSSDGSRLHLRAGIGRETDEVEAATVSAGRDSQAGYTVAENEPVLVDDFQAEDRFERQGVGYEHAPESGISVPIGPPSEPWGVLSASATVVGAFTEADLAFLRNVAVVLASAIERDRAERRRDVEQTLKEGIVEASPIGITIVGVDGEMRFANERAEEIFGRSKERVDELRFDDPEWDEIGVDGEPLEREELPFPRIVDAEEPLYGQVSGVLRPSGERVWVSVNGAPVYDANDELDGVVFAIENVTDRFRRERKLERYETAVETAHDGMYVLDEDRRFELVNDSFAALTAFSREELRGRDATSVFGENVDAVDTIDAEWRTAVDDSRSPTFEETITVGASKTCTVENRFTLLVGEDGSEKRVGVVRDVTERNRLEEQLRAERDLKDEILQTSPVGITLLDADGRNVFANDRAEELFDRPLEELRSYVHDDERWNLVDEDGDPLSGDELPFSTVRGTGAPVYDEVLGIDQPDGTRVWLSAHCAPLFDVDGEFDGAVYALRDVTERKRLESELERTLERVSDAFHAIDTDWRYTYVNERAKELLGAVDRELVGKNVWEVFPTAVGSRFEREYREAMESQETVRFVAYSEVADAWLEVNAYPSETGLSVYFRDVTERREREQLLRETKTRLEAATEAGAVGTWEWDVPADEFVTGSAFAKAFGVDPAAARDGVSIERLLASVHEADRERVRAEIEDALDCCSEYEAEYRIRDDDEIRWVIARGHVECDEGGNPQTFSGALTDITERKQAELEAEQQRTQLETLFDVLPVGVVVADGDGSLLRANDTAREIWGRDVFDAETVVEYENADAVWADSGAPVEPEAWTMVQVLEGEAVVDPNVYEIETADGSQRIITEHGTPIRDECGNVTRAVVVLTDITERREYQRRLEESNERLEQFAYAASHDLQEPLRMVSSYLQLLETRYADQLDDDAMEFIEYAVDGADRMREMIDGLLAYSRVDTAGEPLEPVGLDDVLADVRRDLEVPIEEHDAEILAESLPRVEGDGNQLRQLFQNLLSNAIEYSGDEPPRVEISAVRDDGEWVISVEDDGIGIEPDDADRIFELFERLHAVGQSGSGIGLALCERIVERHGGEIWLESEPGGGSTFFVTLPAATE
ncbi:PAS domain S-box protein [Natronobacterium gregoryi]|uniref:histidine kinase n=2 Tax=Natronobacterium gregoryi TaxID=44930 RepID=L0AFH5_NATGS|nr:PAS domain S-box protein [Natronobacterium gregoryi]AFZ71810.1 PAS domain S-box [Natronobacterium gregoryi SP2]ELY72959.1 PAS/PAC sensor signal transduction histidine kinase [Natronobacterium gregoryi SP2]PLK21009.1 PAS domain S-box protein [Natronobacterium gregoryi SP2]SFI87303.1 PAS domain S-box-containing protein [Natronobacterium gregoryi]